MAITAEFTSDFSDFVRGTKQAETELDKLEKKSSVFGTAWDSALKEVKFDELISKPLKRGQTDAENFAHALDQAGGRIMDLGAAAGTAAPKASTLGGELKEWDKALAAVGIHIGPQIRAIGEMEQAAGKTATALGLLSKALLFKEAFQQGWGVGRAIAELTGSDKIIGDATAKLLGLGDEAQRAGARADILARATVNAKREITDISEAIRINAKAAEEQSLAFGKTKNAYRDTSVAIADWQSQIRMVRKDGNFEQLTKDMEDQNFTLEALAKKYGVHVEALQYLQRQIAATAKTEAEEAGISAQLAERAAAQKIAADKAAADYHELRWKQQLDLDRTLASEGAKLAQQRANEIETAIKREASAQIELNKAMGLTATGAIPMVVSALGTYEAKMKEIDGLRVAGFSTNAQEQLAAYELQQGLLAEAKATDQMVDATSKIPSVTDAAARGMGAMRDEADKTAGALTKLMPGMGGTIPAGAGGAAFGPVTPQYGAGGYIGQGPAGFTGQPLLAGAGGFLGRGVNITINGSVLGNKDEIARVVGDAVTSSYRSGGNRLPV